MSANCGMEAYSDEYAEFIANYFTSEENIRVRYNASCVLPIDNRFLITYIRLSDISFSRTNADIRLPRLFTTVDSGAAKSTNVQNVWDNPYLGMRGTGVIVGFIDTGID